MIISLICSILVLIILGIIKFTLVISAYKTFRSVREADYYKQYDILTFKEFKKVYKIIYDACKDFTYDKLKGIHLYTVHNGLERMACSEDRVKVGDSYIFFTFFAYCKYYKWLKRTIKEYEWKERKQTLQKRQKGLFKEYLD